MFPVLRFGFNNAREGPSVPETNQVEAFIAFLFGEPGDVSAFLELPLTELPSLVICTGLWRRNRSDTKVADGSFCEVGFWNIHFFKWDTTSHRLAASSPVTTKTAMLPFYKAVTEVNKHHSTLSWDLGLGCICLSKDLHSESHLFQSLLRFAMYSSQF